jgi:hypothetical protein
MSARATARALPYRPTPSLEVVARLSVAASLFSWLGVVVALFWR